MADYKFLEFSRENLIVTVLLNRPRVNAINRELRDELGQFIETIRLDKTSVIVLSNRGSVFCAGADLKERETMSDVEVRTFVSSVRSLFFSIYRLPVPTICAMAGTALGGGLELALACDYRIGARKARYGLPETSLGIIPGAGGTQLLPRITSPATAKKYIFSAKAFTGEEALGDGLIDRCVPGVQVLDTALNVAREWSKNAPLALRFAKAAINAGIDISEKNLDIEDEWYWKVIPTRDRQEALAAFREKRSPEWRGK